MTTLTCKLGFFLRRRVASALSRRCLAAALVTSLITTLIAPPAWAQTAQTQVVGRHRAFITTVRGTVEVKAVGQTAYGAARANTEVRTGDKIRTGASSGARIKVGDVGEFDVAASSEVTVGNLQQVRTTARAFFMFQRVVTRDDVAMDLKNGDMRSSFHRVQGRVGNYNVYTPVAVAGVRGTKFELDLEGGRPWYEQMDGQRGDGDEMGLLLIVGEGEVGLTGPNWERTVRGGEQLHSRQGQTPGQSGPADPNRLDGILGSFNNGDTDAGSDTSSQSGGSSPRARTPVPTLTDEGVFPGPTTISIEPPAGAAVYFTTDGSDPGDTNSIRIRIVEKRTLPIGVSMIVKAVAMAENLVPSDVVTRRYRIISSEIPGDTALLLSSTPEPTLTDDGTFSEPINVSITAPTGALVYYTLDGSDPRDTGSSSRIQTVLTTIVPIAATTTIKAYAVGGLSAPSSVVTRVYTISSPDSDTTTALSSSDTATSSTGSETDAFETTFSDFVEEDTFDTNAALVELADDLFDAYENKDASGFLSLVDPTFSGVNNSGNALTYSTLNSSVQADFSILSSVAFDPSVTSISKLNGDKYKVSVTWNGRFRFTSVSTETVKSGMTTEMVFGGARPFHLLSWEGAAPFGLTVPSTGEAELPKEDPDDPSDPIPLDPEDLTPIVSGQTGFVTNRTITGDEQDFAPYTAQITGENFVEGSRVQMLDSDDNIWKDAEGFDQGFTATTTFQNSGLLYLEVTEDVEQYMPGDPSNEVNYWRVINPDGKVSDQQPINFTNTPGPLRLIAVTVDRTVEPSPAASPYSFTVTGYNIVIPVSEGSVVFNPGGGSVMGQVVTNDWTIVPGSLSVQSQGEGQPLQLTFRATVVNSLTPGPWNITITDGRGQQATSGDFTVNNPTNISWNTNQTLNADFTVGSGQTLTISGSLNISTSNGSKINVDNGGTLHVGIATLSDVGISVNTGGNADLTSTTITRSGGVGLYVNGGSATVSGGTISSSSSEGILVGNSGSLTISGSNVNVSSGSTDAIRVADASSVSLSNVTVNSGNTALRLSNGAPTVSLSSSTFSGLSGTAVVVEGGTLNVNGNVSVTGGSNDAILVTNGGNLTTSNSNNAFSGSGSTPNVINYDNAASGTVTLGGSIGISGGVNGLGIFGSGTYQIQNGATVSGAQSNGILVDQGNATVTIGAATISGTANGPGVAVGSCASVDINGANITGNTNGFGVTRTSASILPGYVSLNNVQLSGNNGQGAGVSDMNTSPSVSTSTQYQYLTNPPNSVTNPR